MFESFVSTLWISAPLLVYLERHLHIDTSWWGTVNNPPLNGLTVRLRWGLASVEPDMRDSVQAAIPPPLIVGLCPEQD